MRERQADGSAGDANYGVIGEGYARYRQPDSHIAAQIQAALGAAQSILNVGAGAGSYEPVDRAVVALEPSASMRAQRPSHLPVAIDGVAEHLPFPDRYFDASMATFTVHQWSDVTAGLREMRRVTRGPVVILTCDPLLVERFWLNDYAPLVLATEARRYPSLANIATALGGKVAIEPVSIPLDCRDGFNEAYYGRPHMLLEDGARSACSAWSFVDAPTTKGYVQDLKQSLDDGSWDLAHGHLRHQPSFDGSLRLILSHP
jgi:SAM-dependent methyltransferase